MSSTKTDNRGGAREGAGRKPGKKYVQCVITLRDQDQLDKFKKLGGSDWLKKVIDSAT